MHWRLVCFHFGAEWFSCSEPESFRIRRLCDSANPTKKTLTDA